MWNFLSHYITISIIAQPTLWPLVTMTMSPGSGSAAPARLWTRRPWLGSIWRPSAPSGYWQGCSDRWHNDCYRSRLADTQLGCKLSEAQGRAKRRLRKAVTGNPDKKVRDYMKEVPQVGRIQRLLIVTWRYQVKLVDKLSFTFGVTCIVLTEFLALRYPQYFTSFYLVLMTGLLTNR